MAIILLDTTWPYFKHSSREGPVFSTEASRRQVGSKIVVCGLRLLFAWEKLLPDEWFQKTQATHVVFRSRGLKGVGFLLSFINIRWTANGFLCACVFPFSIGEITSHTGTSWDKIYEVEPDRMDQWNRRNVTQVCSMLYYN